MGRRQPGFTCMQGGCLGLQDPDQGAMSAAGGEGALLSSYLLSPFEGIGGAAPY